MEEKETKYKAINGWELLSQEFEQLAEKAKASAKGGLYTSKPTLSPHFIDYTNGDSHALLSIRVDKGEVFIAYCDLTGWGRPAANNVKQMARIFIETFREPLTDGQLPNYFADYHAVTKEMAARTEMPVSNRLSSLHLAATMSAEERLAQAKSHVEGIKKAVDNVAMPKRPAQGYNNH